MNLKNKVVIITGASQGLGKAIAYKLSHEGAKIALVARTEKLLMEVKNRIVNSGGVAEYFICDISNNQQIEKTVQDILNKLGKIDILVNNAGVWTDENLEKEHPEYRKRAFEVNTLGHINFTYTVLPHFQDQNSGHIFNVISNAGLLEKDNVRWKSYAATKHAMTGFTKSLRDSLAKTKIQVTGFFPGGIDTNLYENVGRQDAHNQPWMMKAEDVADCVAFVLNRPNDVYVESLIISKKM
ncbi:hypothetical protein A2X44_00035 [candidate division CPR3 bacterium GWF2_35_18]|uniref:Oxidoreductase, short chain dehydrogenase/reductase family n=1 Tax=candidate division CPR3 bacterium GW2011_GWF2_35_18 TaxID=1618350 RepID=A0A0G0ERY8_UNCC3|nr:MAG: Oxidoreductase, short chain dehydrogenase/reductase family [candidate division CPR3 bacterium GW2011_GWF2_35_18]KKP85880.1 MAG: Oxidoreductase, short chain dehydrogenase/reductase family [candidate division CPR3 bacterium GW2011_GWE2_35_7]OGB63314.1 MAG: hypothetical protein A2X44_00035 [candidate division CPR3 bacterium GWF2_35_18]OGB65617.1 MAG: hypothetical protein A2250_02475 [candidate division CPR3 bacterium RIFOXYA2_FULL_35_13]OGB76747.1 MAG: hypothetical protein A2476_01980 [can